MSRRLGLSLVQNCAVLAEVWEAQVSFPSEKDLVYATFCKRDAKDYVLITGSVSNPFRKIFLSSKLTFEITPLSRRRVSETVADNLRQAIFAGKLLPGHKLPSEREMAARYQTSRVALREALRALENEGLILIRRGAGGGAFVSDFDNALRALLDSLNTAVKLGQAKSFHLTEVRRMLEPKIAEIATLRATASDLEAIEAVVLAQEEELKKGKLSRRYDMEFHRNVVKATHNPILSIVVNAINDSLREPIFRSKLSQEMRMRVVTNHRSIFEALQRRRPEEACKLMSEHVMAVQGHLEEKSGKTSVAK